MIVLFIVMLPIYFLPSIVGRNHVNSTSIFLLNLFLGWTFLGWVAALIWATKKTENPTVLYQQNLSDSERKIQRFQELFDDGVIGKEEFDLKKAEILSSKNPS